MWNVAGTPPRAASHGKTSPEGLALGQGLQRADWALRLIVLRTRWDIKAVVSREVYSWLGQARWRAFWVNRPGIRGVVQFSKSGGEVLQPDGQRGYGRDTAGAHRAGWPGHGGFYLVRVGAVSGELSNFQNPAARFCSPAVGGATAGALLGLMGPSRPGTGNFLLGESAEDPGSCCIFKIRRRGPVTRRATDGF